MNPKSITVIGAGFSGISAAAYLAQMGHSVTVVEKNSTPGGRARMFETQGFKFDMGPSWYWMPDAFNTFFEDFGYKTADMYDLKRLNPSYRVYFGPDDAMDLPAGESNVIALFDSIDPGSGKRLEHFLREAQYKYEVGMNEFVEKPGHSIMEFADLRILTSMWRLEMLKSISSNIEKITSNVRLKQVLEFPVLFLGAKPSKTPALYSLMNYADISLGTWYPMGGMHEIVRAMVKVAEAQGVNFIYNTAVSDIEYKEGHVVKIKGHDWERATDGIIAACDYHHFEQEILKNGLRRYDESYWDKRVLAPSCLLYYVGLNKKLKGFKHHNLFFDTDFPKHASEIYDDAQWPESPLFYTCVPSVTDATVAPEGHENLFILIPIAPGLEENETIKDQYFDLIVDRIKKITGEDIQKHVVYRRSYGMKNFQEDYHAYKGNAYGLANTLRQTAFLKPKMKHPHLKNLMYAGQLTTPGPGVPPSIVSGRVSAKELNKVLT